MSAHVWRDVWVAHSDLATWRGDRRCRRGAGAAGRPQSIHESLAEFTQSDGTALELSQSVPTGSPLLSREVANAVRWCIAVNWRTPCCRMAPSSIML